MRLIDLIGKTFGKLTVIARDNAARCKATRWLCVCECGSEVSVQAGNLVSGHTGSCGCWKHHKTHTPTYSSWSSMIRRCHSAENRNYPMYGGRGIVVCDRWRNSFPAFFEDMGERPSTDLSIDRIDVDGNYEPGNCRWATRSEQRKNQRAGRRGRMIEFQGRRMCIRQWAKVLGIKERTLAFRIRAGYPLELALTDQLQPGRSIAYRASISPQARRA